MRLVVLAAALATLPFAAAAEDMGIMKTGYADLTDASGASAGSALFRPGPKGLVLRIQASGLEPGWHGVHLHGTGSCDAADGFKGAGDHAGHAEGTAHGLLNPGGLLMSYSCSGGVGPELFQKIVAGAASDAGVDARILRRLGAGADHPVGLAFPEGEYLKGLLCQAA
jgi:hypothetical protein